MKTNERILKYLAGELSEKEKSQLEAELKNNEELKKLFEKCSSQLEEIKSTRDLELNENYFINLIPRVHERIRKNNRWVWIPRLAFVLPVLAIIAFILFYSKGSDKYSKIIADLPDSSKQQIVNYIEKENPSLQDDYLKDTNTKEIIDREISKKINIEDINLEPRLSYSDEYELVNSLSQDEVDNIYDKMMSKKIL